MRNESFELTDTSGAFLGYVEKQLLVRCRKNPRYSLRAFARSIGLSHATLSSLLRGRRKLTSKTRDRIAKALGMTPADALIIRTEPKKGYTDLAPELFASIAEWYHDAILELSRLESFRGDPSWIARRLGITAVEARTALKRLEKLGLLIRSGDGKWSLGLGDSTNILELGYSDAAARQLQKSLLEKAALAIDEISPQARDNTSLTLAIRGSDLPELRKAIQRFRRELDSLAGQSGRKPDQVYQLVVGFYPLTQAES
jgi:transcriptional regulator with XRE-family HTH domain